MERSTRRASGLRSTNTWQMIAKTQVWRRAFVLLVVLAAAPASGQSEPDVAADGSLAAEPYVVYVAQAEAFARCGPSGDFYRTDSLRHGQELEVYVETADGWLGIRPPEDSFCWVPASALKLSGSSDQATVLEDHTVAWIGTHLGRARRYRWQVQLAKGEPVTILGKSERDGPDGPQMWYRIVPPSGEFRWVHRDQVVESTEALVAQSSLMRDEDEQSYEVIPSVQRRPTESREKLASREDEPESDVSRDDESSNTTNISDMPIGSGVRQDWQANETRGRAIDAIDVSSSIDELQQRSEIDQRDEMQPRGAVVRTDANASDDAISDSYREPSKSSLAFVGAPTMQRIGAFESMIPASSELASDANWVGSGVRRIALDPVSMPSNLSMPNSIALASGHSEMGSVAQVGGFGGESASVRQSFHVVHADTIARVEAEARGADTDKLQLMLSRIMAAGSSAEEAEPIARAAAVIAQTSGENPVQASRAQAVVERTRQYQRIAQRRDGSTMIQGSPAPTNSSRFSPPISPASAPLSATLGQSSISTFSGSRAEPMPLPTAPGDWTTQTGYLVQVYSARPNSPPFALTDNSGRTVAYVTPAPGTNLRMHLNNYIRVEGPRGFVAGMDTPHVLVNTATRTSD